MSGVRHVLVTGSAGNLGGKAMKALAGVPDLGVRGIDRWAPEVPVEGAEETILADLAHFDEAWAEQFEGIACVLHLAADPRPVSGWDSVIRLNVDLSLNVLRAAEEAGVRRVVFASSNWVFGGYRFGRERLWSGLPPLPVNPYGASKLFVERSGKSLAERSNVAFLALRVGYCPPGDNRPGPHMAFGRWGQEMWLGNRDWGQAVVRAATAPFSGFSAINIVSRNAGMRWDLEEARATIGFEPEESHEPRQDAMNWIKDRAARQRDRLVRNAAAAPLIGARW